jgi:hypothetical protein
MKNMIVIFALLVAGCGASMEQVQINADVVSAREVVKRAVYDLNCTTDQITAKRVAGEIAGPLGFGAPNGTWVAEGCGKKMMYQVTCVANGFPSSPEEYKCNPMLEGPQAAAQVGLNSAHAATAAAQQQAAAAAQRAQQAQQAQRAAQQQAQQAAFKAQQQQWRANNNNMTSFKAR